MTSLSVTANRVKDDYWPLIKGRQTLLLTLTGAAGFLSQPSQPADWGRLASVAGSLAVALSGCTILNMVIDRDLDRRMARTRARPLAAGRVDGRTAAALGGVLLATGLGWALALSLPYFALGVAGAAIDVVAYTLWLKRRSAWSIVCGGLAGGIPILAGRALATGRIDAAGLLLALAIVCWIPSHNLTLVMLYVEDYLQAGVPTFQSVYGLAAACAAITLSGVLTAALTTAAFAGLHFSAPAMLVLTAGNAGLIGLACLNWMRRSRRVTAVLYKYSSAYMLVAMLLLAAAAWTAGR